MKRVFIIHGWEGDSEGDWMPWITKELENLGYEAVCPDMPETNAPKIDAWVNTLTELVGTPDVETYFIGHSIGCQTILRYLEKVDTKVGGALLVAPWLKLVNLEGPKAEAIAQPWIETPINFEKVKENINKSIAILSDNDEWVPYEETKNDFETKLGSQIVTIHEGGHMTEDDGYTEFPQALEEFKKL